MRTLKKIRAKISTSSKDGKGNETQISKKKLLELAKIYRQQYPEKWRQTKRQLETRDRELLGYFEMPPYLKAYYKTVSQTRQQKKQREEERQKEPRKVKVLLQFNLHHSRFSSTDSLDSETECEFPATNHNLLDSLLGDDDDDKNKPNSELVVTVVKVKNIHNGFKDVEERMAKLRIKMMLLPDSEIRSKKIQTPFRFLTEKGTTRFEYKVYFRGFTKKQLEERTLLFVGKGENEDCKAVVGQGVLCGTSAFVNTDKKGVTRRGTMDEIRPLQEALSNPGKSVPAIVNLIPQEIQVDDKTSPSETSVETSSKEKKSRKHLTFRFKF